MNRSRALELLTQSTPILAIRYGGVIHLALFGYPVDLVTEKALRAELRPFIEKEAVHV